MSQIDIVLKGICKSYGRMQVLAGLNAVLREGTITFITGPSGCGKTTLLRILLGLTQPDSGSIIGIPSSRAAVFQEDRLLPDLTARQNLRAVLGKRVPDATILSALDALQLSPHEDKPVRDFSGGMKRRVALARAVLSEAELTVLDEPTSGLDADTRELAVRWTLEHLQGRTAVWITHELSQCIPEGYPVLRML